MPNVCLFPVKDSFMNQPSPDTNYGNSPGMYLGITYIEGSKSGYWRVIMHFTIPAEVALGEVYLGLLCLFQMNVANGGVNTTFSRVTKTGWTELGVTYHKYDGVNLWDMEGGDSDTPTITVPLPPTGSCSWTVDITDLVKDAITNRGRELHFMAILANEDPGVNTYATWLSKDQSDVYAYARPYLNIVRPPFGKPREV